MKRRFPSLPKSPFKGRAFLRRATRRAILLSLAMISLTRYTSAANTQYNVKNGSTDLTAAATYTTAGGTAAATGPTVTSDVLFNSGVVYAPAAFTLGTSQTFGSLNDLSATALTISNTGGVAASTLTLGGAGDLGDGVVGSSAADLLFVGRGASLTLTGGTGNAALNLALGQSGNFDVAGTATISSIISGAGFGITKTGTGALQLSGANTFSGGVSIQSGQVNLSSAAGLGTGALSLGASSGNASATLTFNPGTNLTVANAINVNAGSTGTLQIQDFSGAATFTGAVTLANNLLLSNTNTAANTLTFSGGFTGTGNVTVANTSVSATTISGATSNFTGTLTNANMGSGGLTVSSNLGGAVSFVQNSNSTTTLSGADTYTGPTTINFGTVALSNTGSLASGSNVTFGGTGALSVAGKTGGSTQTLGTLTSGAGDNTVTSTFGTVNTTLAIGTYTRSAGATTNFVASGGANGTTNLITLGNVTANTFISPGTFFGGSSYAFYDAGGFVRALSYAGDATAANASTSTGSQAVLPGTLSSTSNVQYVGSAGTATTATAASTTTTLAVTDGTLFQVGETINDTTKASGGVYVTAISGNTLTLSGALTVAVNDVITPLNSVTAQTTATVNTLNLSGPGANVTLGSGATLTTNGILRSGGTAISPSFITGGTSITAGGVTDFVIATPLTTDVLTITTPVNANGVPLVKSGAGTVTLGSAFTNSNGIAVNAGTLTLSGVVSGPGSVIVNGGSVGLNAANTYSGGTFLYGGGAGLGGTSTPFGTGPLTIGAPGSGVGISLSVGTSTTYANPITVNAGGQRYVYTGGSPTFAFSGAITLNSGANFSVGSGGGGNLETISGGITGTGNFISGSPAGNSRTSNVALTTNAINMVGFLANNTSASLANGGFGYGSDSAAGSTTQVSAQIGSNVTALYQNSATNTFQLSSASNPFFGDTNVLAGTLNLRNATTLQNSVVNFTGGAATFGTSTTVGLNTVTLGGLGGTGNVNLNNTLTTPTAVALTIGNSNASNGSTTNPNTLNPTYSGVLSNTNGAASVTKVGTNTQTFTGINTYTGATTVSGGTLTLAGVGRTLTGTTAINVNNGGTLFLGTANQVNTTAMITMGTTAAQTPASTTGVLSFAAGANQGTAETLTGGTAAGGPTVAGLGALTLSNTATLAFGGAGTTLVFGTFTPNGNVLNITGYTNTGAMTAGNSGTAADDRLVFSGDQTANLASFNFGAGLSAGEVALDNGFYEVTVSAVPEPSTWMAGIACLGFVSYRLVRSRRQAR